MYSRTYLRDVPPEFYTAMQHSFYYSFGTVMQLIEGAPVGDSDSVLLDLVMEHQWLLKRCQDAATTPESGLQGLHDQKTRHG